MGKSFKISEQQAPRDGRRTVIQIKSKAPPQIVDEARATGISTDKVVHEEEVPDHPIAQGSKDKNSEIPWPKAGQINDTNSKPMKLK